MGGHDRTAPVAYSGGHIMITTHSWARYKNAQLICLFRLFSWFGYTCHGRPSKEERKRCFGRGAFLVFTCTGNPTAAFLIRPSLGLLRLRRVARARRFDSYSVSKGLI
ncbi:hypothetical protein OPV22_009235 [Ensete ventricosum]|uniref:Uncharacterized protein n=1 Tax=Ensete ventricosum TaxID=4639 RepID=A0AAV8R4R4_ENSVE|nr:hypothetical protein OPV22_009235 [Ensete ventricosum]